ncbi:FAD-dependent oxidoreductase [Stackebrandtia endophytica]|nr:FAD-dependent oxidoreductase [Stackebrandtia endophytica]
MVVGAGVSGLTSAIALAEAGFDVGVVSERTPRATTSAVAGASWGPHMVDDPRVARWARVGWEAFTRLAGIEDSAVRMVSGIEADPAEDAIPEWAQEVPGFRVCDPGEAPPEYHSAWRYTIPLIDMPRYLDHLVARATTAGVGIEWARVESLGEVSGDVVVNCTGLGAAELLGDPALRPVRGQMVVTPNPGLSEFFLGNAIGTDLTVIFPHSDHLVLGGTGVDRASTEWDEAVERAIMRRCARIDSRIADLPVIGRRVGLRPVRGGVRLERDSHDPRVIHNYGHGGSGVTLSWGCAADVLAMVTAMVSD